MASPILLVGVSSTLKVSTLVLFPRTGILSNRRGGIPIGFLTGLSSDSMRQGSQPSLKGSAVFWNEKRAGSTLGEAAEDTTFGQYQLISCQ